VQKKKSINWDHGKENKRWTALESSMTLNITKAHQ
jgi:hypothetical protein